MTCGSQRCCRRLFGFFFDHGGHLAGPELVEKGCIVAHNFGHGVSVELLELRHPVGRLGEALDVGPVGPEDHAIVTHQLDDLVHVVLPERVDPYVAPERDDGVLPEIAGHLAGRAGQLAKQRDQELRSVLHRSDAHVREAVEEPLEDERDQEVVGRPVDGEHPHARGLASLAEIGREALRRRSRWSKRRRRRRGRPP